MDTIVEEIKEFPQTYETILKEDVSDGTCQTLLRTKLNKLIKEGIICKTTIPGTRFGKSIFYMIPKKYFILVENGRLGINVYCFFEYEKLSVNYIKIKQYWKLEKNNWNKKYDVKAFFRGSVLKFM